MDEIKRARNLKVVQQLFAGKMISFTEGNPIIMDDNFRIGHTTEDCITVLHDMTVSQLSDVLDQKTYLVM